MINSINISSNISANKNIYAKSQKPSFGMAFRQDGMDDTINNLSQSGHDRYLKEAKRLDRKSDRKGFDIDLYGYEGYDQADFVVRSKKHQDLCPDRVINTTKGDFAESFPDMTRSLELEMNAKAKIIKGQLALQKQKDKLVRQIFNIGR